MLSSLFNKTTAIALVLGLTLLAGCASREERIQKLRTEADNAFFEDKTERGIRILRKGLNKFPDSNEIRIALSHAVARTGDLQESLDLLESVVKSDPEQDDLWVEIGELHAKLGQSEQAIVAFDSYLANHASDFLAWKALAQENEKTGKLAAAIDATAKWNNLTPSAAPALKLGKLYQESGNVPQARSWFSQAAAYPNSEAAKEALIELIELETDIRQFQQATIWLKNFQDRYGAENQDSRILQSIRVLDNWRRAREELAQAAAELEEERRSLEQQHREQAERRAREAQQANTQDANETPTGSQNDQPTGGGPAESIDAGDGIEKEPVALFGDENASEASDPIESQTVESDPETLSQRDAAILALEQGNYDTAITLLWNLISDEAEDAQLWSQLSTAYFAQEKWFDAEACVLEAKRLSPRDGLIAYQYLQTIRNTQKTNRVLEEIKALKLLFPRNQSIALILAQTLRDAEAANRVVTAAYQDYLSMANPSDPGYAEARQYLQNGN